MTEKRVMFDLTTLGRPHPIGLLSYADGPIIDGDPVTLYDPDDGAEVRAVVLWVNTSDGTFGFRLAHETPVVVHRGGKWPGRGDGG